MADAILDMACGDTAALVSNEELEMWSAIIVEETIREEEIQEGIKDVPWLPAGPSEARDVAAASVTSRMMDSRRKGLSSRFLVPSGAENPKLVSAFAQPQLLGGETFQVPAFFSPDGSSKIFQVFDKDTMRQHLQTTIYTHYVCGGQRAELFTVDLSGGNQHPQTALAASKVLRQAFERERPCVRGQQCRGYTDLGHILVEYRSTQEQIEAVQQGFDDADVSRTPRQCLRCLRALANEIYQYMKHYGQAETVKQRLLNFYNLSDQPGEYDFREMVWIPGVLGPIVMDIPGHYEATWNASERVWYHVEKYYIRPTLQDFQLGPGDSHSSHCSLGPTNLLQLPLSVPVSPRMSLIGWRCLQLRARVRNDNDALLTRLVRLNRGFPDWARMPLDATALLLRSRARSTEGGTAHFHRPGEDFAWRPWRHVQLADHSLYVALVNRVDYCMQLLRRGEFATAAARLAVEEWLNCHVPLIVFVEALGDCSDVAIERIRQLWPAEGLGFGAEHVPNMCVHVSRCRFWEAARSKSTPSLELLEHPADVALTYLLTKALPWPSLSRGLDAVTAECWKQPEAHAIYETIRRLVAVGLLGLLPHATQVSLMSLRIEVHRWFVFEDSAPRGREAFDVWMTDNLSLYSALLRERTIFTIGQTPGLIDHMKNEYFWAQISYDVYNSANVERNNLSRRDFGAEAVFGRWRLSRDPNARRVRVTALRSRPLKPPKSSKRRSPKPVYSTATEAARTQINKIEFTTAKLDYVSEFEFTQGPWPSELPSEPWRKAYLESDSTEAERIRTALKWASPPLENAKMTDNIVPRRQSGSGRRAKMSLKRLRKTPPLPNCQAECREIRDFVFALSQTQLSTLSLEFLAPVYGVDFEESVLPLLRARESYESESDRSPLRDVLLDVRLQHPRDFKLLSAFFGAVADAQLIHYWPLPRNLTEMQLARYRELNEIPPDAPLPPAAGVFMVCRNCVSLRHAVLLCCRPGQSSEERKYFTPDERCNPIHDAISGRIFCGALLSRDRHRTAFVGPLARGSLIPSMISVARRNQVEQRCATTELESVSLLGRVMRIGQGKSEIFVALCPHCLQPFRLERSSFDRNGVPCCGCAEMNMRTKNTAVSEEQRRQERLTGQRCAIPSCSIVGIEAKRRVFDDLNYPDAKMLGFLGEVGFCERHARYLPPYSKDHYMRLSMLQHIYRNRLRELSEPGVVYFARKLPRPPPTKPPSTAVSSHDRPRSTRKLP